MLCCVQILTSSKKAAVAGPAQYRIDPVFQVLDLEKGVRSKSDGPCADGLSDFEWSPFSFFFFGKGDPFQIGQTLRAGKSCLNRFGRSQSLTRRAGLQEKRHTETLAIELCSYFYSCFKIIQLLELERN